MRQQYYLFEKFDSRVFIFFVFGWFIKGKTIQNRLSDTIKNTTIKAMTF